MLRTMVSLRDTARTVHAEVHDALADIVLAAIAVEPTTVEELVDGMTRFVDLSVAEFFMQKLHPGIGQGSKEGGHAIIDMTARLLVNWTAVPELPRLGNVLECDEHDTLRLWLPYRVPDDWKILTDDTDWQQVAARRREQWGAEPEMDVRQVLYGRAAEVLVDRWQKTAAELPDPVSEIQQWWLLTPREDLGGRTPRQVLMAKRRFVDGDIEDVGQIWMMRGTPPPGLSLKSHAYRYGGFGTHEIIIYHEMVQQLLQQCARRFAKGQPADSACVVRQVEQYQQKWLHQPHEDLYQQSPAATIARERSRLPAVVPPGHECFDDDCPLCRMMADRDQPMIWQLHNCLLENNFATSFYDTPDQWEEAQRIWEEVDRECDREMSFTAPTPPSPYPTHPETSLWQSSYTNLDGIADMPPMEACAVVLFAVGGHLGELVQELRKGNCEDEMIRLLHHRFDDLRVLAKEVMEPWKIEASVADFVATLRELASQKEDLRGRCLDLCEKLDFVVDRYAAHQGRRPRTIR